MNVFISSMEDFASINAVYATHFGVSPPARACVAVDLPHPLRMILDCVAYAEQKACDRKALHVQGLSYWAPANIGPYSQAIVVRTKLRPASLDREKKCRAVDAHIPYLYPIQVDERVFVSGQIGLVPCSLGIPSPQSLATEIALASQHSDRIVKALSGNAGGAGGPWDTGHAQLILYWVTQEPDISHAIAAAQRLDVSLGKKSLSGHQGQK
jgi:diphthine-ammonia ligase